MTKVNKNLRKKNYKQAPLPFQGQKRRFLKKFDEALETFPSNGTYIDIFGGSGLLAHHVKQKYPLAKVIWNDYDNFKDRLKAIPNTNILLADLRLELKNAPRDKKVFGKHRESILNLVKKAELDFGYVDYVTLSASLLFGGKYANNFKEFEKMTFYNRIRLNDYACEGYLNGVNRISEDYKIIFENYKSQNIIFLVDPPYLSTDTTTYKSENYWKLRDYLDVLNLLDNSPYFYFTSNKSEIIELCEWIETRSLTQNPFTGSSMSTTNNRLNKDSGYTDIMLWKNH
ncbi:DNA adenine methylase [Zunongwangia sp. HGR-M22]|uniref:DNA adenine methylase n=1 Tax=Zunongwangia sp. HGR-M22 TaxID=3015168 RepID=UPI0022DE550B|nr:DNA adenine methylase [Zunongwangia sp. HGR-M22]WBL25110.1 DNA adenine methylase [Zunongwangia sp. HGR-M22]